MKHYTSTPRALITIILLLSVLGSSQTITSAQDATPGSGPESELSSPLPVIDLPTMNLQSYTFELESAWQGDAASVPEEAPIFEVEPVNYDQEDVADVAETLDVDGEITEQGAGTYTVEGEGSIYTTPGLLQFVSAVEAPDEALPDDEAAIAYARDWLRISGLMPADMGDGSIVARIEEPARLIVEFLPANPAPLLSSTPGITVTVGPAGSILESRVSWATITEADTYRLRGVSDAFTLVEGRQSYLDVTLPIEQFPQGSSIAGVVTYDGVSIAYTSSGTIGEAQYLQPVYIFTGTLTPEGSDETFPISAYVPAIVTELQPVG